MTLCGIVYLSSNVLRRADDAVLDTFLVRKVNVPLHKFVELFLGNGRFAHVDPLHLAHQLLAVCDLILKLFKLSPELGSELMNEHVGTLAHEARVAPQKNKRPGRCAAPFGDRRHVRTSTPQVVECRDTRVQVSAIGRNVNSNFRRVIDAELDEARGHVNLQFTNGRDQVPDRLGRDVAVKVDIIALDLDLALFILTL